ncbi:MAG: hypothetical protein M3R44_05530 [Candidatus Eremiobacteraeota bacterium]|nr:hypothetical protein [Candidatus Eremiobacteraeota bacterium]
MATHKPAKSPAPRTYTPSPALGGHILTCTRCRRVYPYPAPGGPPIRCECGWWYENHDGLIAEEFKPRLGV